MADYVSAAWWLERLDYPSTHLNVRPLDDLSDEQLLMCLRVLTKQAAPLLARVAEDDGEDDAKPGGLRH